MTGYDPVLFDLFNREWTSLFLDRFLPVFSSFDVWKPVMIATAIGLLIFGKGKGRQFLLCVAIGLLLGDGVISQGLKELVNRPRPRDVHVGTIVRSLSQEKPRLLHVLDPPLVKKIEVVAAPGKRGRSFPSSHVLNVFMLATVALRFHRVIGLILVPAGLLVAWSRVYCGAHWPGDLPVSILFGVGVGVVTCSIVSGLSKRFGWTGLGGVATLPETGPLAGSHQTHLRS